MTANAKALFLRRRQRVRRNRIAVTANGRPRLSVFRSSQHIYAQVIDDAGRPDLAAASSLDKSSRRASRPAPTRPRPARSANCSPSGPRPPGVERVVSIAAPICFMAGSKPWPTPPARAAGFLGRDRWHRHGSGRGRANAGRTARPRRRRPPVARPRGQRIRRKAGQHQPRRQGGEGRPAVRLCRARRRRRQQGPGRLRLGQGARGAGGDPQGDRAGAPQHDPRAVARRPHAASRHHRPLRRRRGDRARRARPAPASSPAARCARSSRRSASRTWWRSRSARPTRTT